jgi:hypothetical protein
MIVKNINVYNMCPAILGIRNAMKSKDKSDSVMKEIYSSSIDDIYVSFNHCIIGEEDEKLIKKLLNGHLAHQERKFMRQILVSMDIKMSIKAWSQMDTFKVATVRNSESTMHSITKGEITKDDFEREINKEQIEFMNKSINLYNKIKKNKLNEDSLEFIIMFEAKTKGEILQTLFEEIDANLPGGYLLESHWTANYEVLRNIYHSRKNHKMYWWKEFCQYIQKLPYFDLLIKD